MLCKVLGRRSATLPFLAVLTLVLAGLSLCARAQNGSDPIVSVTPPVSPGAAPTPAPEVHRFWDRTNLLLFSGIAVVRGLDYASTRNFQARGREETLLPDEVVNNSAGFAALEAAATGTSIALSYLLHRTGHHKLERWLSIGHITITAAGDIRNYTLKSASH